MSQLKKNQLSKFVFALIIYTVLVILWGAWVRISHSGDGCGDSWPLCKGTLLPSMEKGKTWVELSHRLTSGIFGFLVVYLFVQTRKIYPQGAARATSLITLILTVSEALLGAKLVLLKLVGSDDSWMRGLVMPLHQLNSFLLSGSAVLWFVSIKYDVNWTFSKIVKTARYIVPAFLIIGVTGAWASLSTTLFESSGLLDGLLRDFNADSHYIYKLRILHPSFALTSGTALAVYFYMLSMRQQEQNQNFASTRRLSLMLATGLIFGIMTLLLLSPVWMKLTHLAIAHGIWCSLVYWLSAAQFEKRT